MEVTSRPGYQSDVITELEKSDQDFYAEWNNFLLNVIEPYLQRERTLLVSKSLSERKTLNGWRMKEFKINDVYQCWAS